MGNKSCYMTSPLLSSVGMPCIEIAISTSWCYLQQSHAFAMLACSHATDVWSMDWFSFKQHVLFCVADVWYAWMNLWSAMLSATCPASTLTTCNALMTGWCDHSRARPAWNQSMQHCLWLMKQTRALSLTVSVLFEWFCVVHLSA